MLARLGLRGQPLDRSVRPSGRIHEQVDRLRSEARDWLDPERLERVVEVLLTRGVPALDAETLVTCRITGRDQHVVDSRRVVLFEREDRAPPVRDELLAETRKQPVDVGACVLRAVVLTTIVGDECPSVRNLSALNVDDAKTATLLDPHCAPLPRRDVDRRHDGSDHTRRATYRSPGGAA